MAPAHSDGALPFLAVEPCLSQIGRGPQGSEARQERRRRELRSRSSESQMYDTAL
jgi:hypothetical protein